MLVVAPADKHGDAAADDVEACPVLLHRLHALLRQPLLPPWPLPLPWRLRGRAAAAGGCPGAAHAGRVAPVQHSGTCCSGAVHDVCPAGSAPALLGQLPLLVPAQRIHTPVLCRVDLLCCPVEI
uniref:Uncharacterized protein n=1 Tax=Arundo donax TaxID=35708 RepID=A0A0A9BHJ6_ARUDO